jgi:hypothetical protein
MVVFGISVQHADTAYPLGLLCVPGERPCRRPAESGDEVPPLHSITSSARSSMPGGTVRPIALALFRLMISFVFGRLLNRELSGTGALEDVALYLMLQNRIYRGEIVQIRHLSRLRGNRRHQVSQWTLCRRGMDSNPWSP